MNITYNWNEDSGVATCNIRIGDKTFIGEAFCASEDRDVMSEFTGCTIALQRAQLKVLLDEKNNILIPGLKALKQLFYSINKSKKYDRYSYEATMLYNQIQHYEEDIKYLNQAIYQTKYNLKQYLSDKEKFHTNLRKVRQKEDTQNN